MYLIPSLMSNPTRKQLLVESLKSLHKARTRALFRIKAINLRRKDLASDARAASRELDSIERKMSWEMATNGKSLGDKA